MAIYTYIMIKRRSIFCFVIWLIWGPHNLTNLVSLSLSLPLSLHTYIYVYIYIYIYVYISRFANSCTNLFTNTFTKRLTNILIVAPNELQRAERTVIQRVQRADVRKGVRKGAREEVRKEVPNYVKYYMYKYRYDRFHVSLGRHEAIQNNQGRIFDVEHV